jgi:hypothetical protein
MAGYERQSTIANGDEGTADLWNNEYNQLESAFSNTTGHRHDGTTLEGPVIGLIGDAGLVTPLNKVQVTTGTNTVGVYINVASSAVEQVRFQDGSMIPVLTNDVDMGTDTLKFKDAYFTGTVKAGSLLLGSGATITSILDEDDLVSDSATALATQQSIKAYATTALALKADLDGPTFTNTVTFASLVGGSGATITGFLDEDTMSSDSATVGATQQSIKAYVDGEVSSISSDTALKADIASPTFTGTVTLPSFKGTAGATVTQFLDEDTMASDSATAGVTQQSVKAYVDAQVISANALDGALAQGNTTGGTDIEVSSGDSITTAVSGVSIAEFSSDGTLAGNSDTAVPTEQAVKTYTDNQIVASATTIATFMKYGAI